MKSQEHLQYRNKGLCFDDLNPMMMGSINSGFFWTTCIDYKNSMVIVRPAPSEAARYRGCRTANVRFRQNIHIWGSDDGDDDAISLYTVQCC